MSFAEDKPEEVAAETSEQPSGDMGLGLEIDVADMDESGFVRHQQEAQLDDTIRSYHNEGLGSIIMPEA